MRNLLSAQAALVHGLVDGALITSLCAAAEDATKEDTSDAENGELSKIENWLAEFLDNLEVLMAEKRVNEAMAALDEGQNIADEANGRHTLSPSALLSLQTAITEQRQKLADQLAETICQPSTHAVELRSTVLALKALGDGPRAHSLLLNSHQQKLQRNMQSLRSSYTSYGGVFTAALSQLVFSTIAQAASDSLAVFGEEPAFSSELVSWAVKQCETFALIVKRNTLASSAASGVLRDTSECLQICMGHCSLLEARGLALSPVLLRLFRPYIEQAVNANLRRIEQSCSALAVTDDWSLAYSPTSSRHSSSMITSLPKLSISANRFSLMVQVI